MLLGQNALGRPALEGLARQVLAVGSRQDLVAGFLQGREVAYPQAPVEVFPPGRAAAYPLDLVVDAQLVRAEVFQQAPAEVSQLVQGAAYLRGKGAVARLHLALKPISGTDQIRVAHTRRN